MTKQEFLAKVASKPGFHSIISDEFGKDHRIGDPIEQRCLYLNHTNGDGTMGKTYVYYIYDTANDVASFWNQEVEAFDMKEVNTLQKKVNALEAYLKANFDAYFLIPEKVDIINNWAEGEAFTLNAGKLTRKKVLVFKKGANPISHLEIV